MDTTRPCQIVRSPAACLINMLALLAWVFSAPGQAATYYVSQSGSNASAGSQLSPWRTIQKAVNTMVGGDTTIVTAGTYGEIVNTVRSGTSAYRIVIKASGKVVTKTFNIDHHHITVDGFEMTAANQGHMMTITGSYCQVVNNVIHDTGARWGVIRMDGLSITGCLIRGNRFYSSTGPGNDLPLIIVSGKNNRVEYNEIGPARDLDVFRVWGDGNIIRGNYIHDITFSPGSVAHMDVLQTFGVPGRGDIVARRIVFEKNKIINFAGQICMTEHNGSAVGMRDWDIRNNIFVNVPQQANIGIPNMRFYNNTFYNVGASNRLVLYAYNSLPKGDSAGAQFFNNIIIAASNIVSYSSAISVSSPGTRADYNYVANINGFRPLEGFTESHGINGGDPRFLDAAANLFLLRSGSPAIDKGTTSSSFQDDLSGRTRPQGSAWDIGAFEYVGQGVETAGWHLGRDQAPRYSMRVPSASHRPAHGPLVRSFSRSRLRREVAPATLLFAAPRKVTNPEEIALRRSRACESAETAASWMNQTT